MGFRGSRVELRPLRGLAPLDRLRRSPALRAGRVRLDGAGATGEGYTIAHHVFTEAGSRKIMVASLRYLDTFVKIDGRWYFGERKLMVDWSETRSLSAA